MTDCFQRSSSRCVLLLAACCAVSACGGPRENTVAPVPEAPAAPTNRVDIPAAVRANLGITFAKAEYRDVARTLRLPGRFELLPSARREYCAPLGGRIELLVAQYDVVQAGTPLYRLDSAAWRELVERQAALEALVASMGPLRDAHRVHEEALAEKVALWTERLAALDVVRAAGGADANRVVEVHATLIATRAELAEIMEKDAELEGRQSAVESELRSVVARRAYLRRALNASETAGEGDDGVVVVRALADGVVEHLAIAEGGVSEESSLVVTIVQPQAVRFRATGLQADLFRLRDGLPVRIVAASADAPLGALSGSLRLAPTADAERRTIDVLVAPEPGVDWTAAWARAGVVAQLEVTLAGGESELAVPLGAVVRDGGTPILFRRDPADPDRAIRIEADLGVDDGRWIVVRSGLREGDELVLGGNYQLMLATSGSAPKGGHFHSDGTFHEGEH